MSWRTILGEREAFRQAFVGFDFERVARLGARDVDRLLRNAGIVRHRGKIESTINNAKTRARIGCGVRLAGRVLLGGRTRPAKVTRDALATMSTSVESVALSKDLKKRGWTFVGPTTIYAFMQAMGRVNDHVHDCAIRKTVVDARKRFRAPTASRTPSEE